jgi:hypothetical protein
MRESEADYASECTRSTLSNVSRVSTAESSRPNLGAVVLNFGFLHAVSKDYVAPIRFSIASACKQICYGLSTHSLNALP